MSKRLILSVGLQKTASTSLQQTCAANRGLLQAAGFGYPRFSFSADGEPRESSNHTGLLKFMFASVPGFDQERRAAVRGKLAASLQAEPAGALMVAEGVSIFKVDALREMRSWFQEQGWELEVVCHVRHLSTWVPSMVGQRVTGHLRRTIPDMLDEFVRRGGLARPRIENIREVFPDARFRSHERAVKHPQGPVGFFLEEIGVPLDGIKFKNAREGRSDCAVRTMSVLHEKFGRDDPRGKAAGELLKAITGPKFLLREAEAAPLLPMIDEENRWLRDTFGEDFVGPPMSYGPVDWTDAGRAALAAALKKMPPEARKWLVDNKARWTGAVPVAGPSATIH